MMKIRSMVFTNALLCSNMFCMKKMTKIYEFPVVVEKDIDGSYFVMAPSLQGCYTSGKTLQEALLNIKDAISLYVKDLKADKKAIPNRKPISLTSIEVFA